MSRYAHCTQQQLISRVEQLETTIRSVASAPNELERKARIEMALAEVEGRKPEHWAQEYMDYATSESEQYF